ncbi:TonB-dependent hemoglobin/transferrin/lactoferrin family receptor [Marilutibacter alkalisoli]|uniref:TonB-dependent hemoglobin/transferrin/lactoferrin family receptor n=1 Tax=Marilutibacter alkalisoli TaxID=2591633 RepID=A0A514BPG4_9GAMM|nr:TonB-dependent hemoglobin/transferrin/lactoferrin family receptor [Lysobacter alkalisoli]QDH69272.1 TonB-dependent hemoglobin/transferrin/lactoferrin family receptor [Lysobacter alkalisoli]
MSVHSTPASGKSGRRFLVPNSLALAVLASLPITAAAFEAGADAAGATADLERIVVTATRTERAIADVPATVTAINREEMDKTITRDLKDLFRYEPAITVTSDPVRFGIGDIRIRGLGGNRVRLQVDGIPVSDAFSIGSFSNANRNFVDLDSLKAVEVVRGPSSALYGSDALGGVVALISKDPADYLDAGKDGYFGFKLGYDGDWKGLFGSATAAFGGERWSGLVTASHHQGQETGNKGENRSAGSARTAPNPQDRDGRSVLSKLVYAHNADNRMRLTVEGNEDTTHTNVLSALGPQVMNGVPTGATTTAMTGHDHQTRARVSLDWESDSLGLAFADSLGVKVYRQDSETTQDTREARTTATAGPHVRNRQFNFDQREHGLQANLRKDFAIGNVAHAMTYGLELARERVRQKRDGRVVFPNGVSTPVMPPDTFPVRDFPNSETTTAALYLQDEITFAGGQVSLVPGLRVDHYRLKPELDPIFAEDNPGVAISELKETSVSPKLGVVWRFAGDWSMFAGYSHGFRAPPYNDVNLGFTNLQFGYTAIPNPDLKPETSDGIEAGLRFAGDRAHASLSAYYNRYDDFIESLRFIGFNPQGLMVFQSQNVADAEIYGIEFSGGLMLDAFASALDGWSLRAAAAWSKGEDRADGTPLAGIDPLRATLGLGYDREAWGVELAGRFAARKRDLPTEAGFATPGYGVLDLLAHWDFAPGATVNAGVFNLADRKYWASGDLPAGAAASSASLDRYTAPGRNLGISLSVNW